MVDCFEKGLNSGWVDGMESVLNDIDDFCEGMRGEGCDVGGRYNGVEVVNKRV